MKFKLIEITPTECDCYRCSLMCCSPCCGTPQDVLNLMKNGFGDRLMIDDYPEDEIIIKPALKGYEGQKSPFKTASVMGCTFWKHGLCELHSLGLKPKQGKLALHGQNEEESKWICDLISKSWTTKKAAQVIEKWSKEYLKQSPEVEND